MHRLLRPFVYIALVSLAGCSSTFRTYTQTLELAFNSDEGVSLTNAELSARDRDVLYAKVGSLPNALLVLAFIEHGQHKWLSADDAMLVLEDGRLVKTTGFKNNLLYMSDRSSDPLKQKMTKIQAGLSWQSITDWSEHSESGSKTEYEVLHTEISELELLGHNFQTKLVTEQVKFPDGQTSVNQFWFELKTGWLLKSRQNIGPLWPEIELVHISTAGRLLGVVKKGSAI